MDAQAITVTTTRGSITLKLLTHAAGRDKTTPLALSLPKAAICLPLTAQLLLMGIQAGHRHFRQQGHFPGRAQYRKNIIRTDLLHGGSRMHPVIEHQAVRVGREPCDAPGRIGQATTAAEADISLRHQGVEAERGQISLHLGKQTAEIEANDIAAQCSQLSTQLIVEQP